MKKKNVFLAIAVSLTALTGYAQTGQIGSATLVAGTSATCVAQIVKNGFSKIEMSSAEFSANGPQSLSLTSREVLVEIERRGDTAEIFVTKSDKAIGSASGLIKDLVLEINLENEESVFISCLAAPPAPPKQ